MMNRNQRLTILLALTSLLISCLPLSAQLVLKAQLRTRGEMNHGYKFIPDTSAVAQYYIMQRTRLTADYTREGMTFRLAMQDIRAWGGETLYTPAGGLGNESGFDIHEAWTELKLNDELNIRLGRQELRYDDQRLLGINDWNPYGLAYDALVLKYRKSKLWIDMGLSWNSKTDKILGTNEFNNHYYSDMNRIRMLEFLYLRKDLNPKWYLSWIGLITGYQKPGTMNTIYALGTTGLYTQYRDDAWFAKTYGYYQTGRNSKGQEVRAWMMHASAKANRGKVSLGVGVDILSGHDATNLDPAYQKMDHAFDILYGGRFIFNGWMNQFVNLKPATRNGGLVDVHPNLTYRFNERTDIQLVMHIFRLHSPVAEAGSVIPSYYAKPLGTEYDMMFTRKFSKEIELKGGFSYYQSTLTLEALKGVAGRAKQAYWGWVMLQVSPELFRQ